MNCLILIILVLLLLVVDNVDNFTNCGPSTPNISPPEWYIPENLNLKNWATRIYPDRGSIEKNFNSTAYRYWQY
jgi:hypothetical protein